MIASTVPSLGQALDAQVDPRELSLDIFGGIKRGVPPATVALKLGELIPVFRLRCTRVTDYQIFEERPNLYDLKVKCSGNPLYGVTVASNGYVAVYGGNGILAGLDRRDGTIFSFAATGALEDDTSRKADEAVQDVVSRLSLGGDFNLIYMLALLGIGLVLAIIGMLGWYRAWKSRVIVRHRRRLSAPLDEGAVAAEPRYSAFAVASATKDQLVLESKRVAPHVYKHPSGTYISQGRRGKRRFFKSFLWAFVYSTLGWKLFETHAPDTITTHDHLTFEG